METHVPLLGRPDNRTLNESSGDVILRLTAEIAALKAPQVPILVLRWHRDSDCLLATIGLQIICNLNCSAVGKNGAAEVGIALELMADILGVAVMTEQTW
jgi:hypothetical protein